MKKNKEKTYSWIFQDETFFFSLSSGIHMKNYAGSCLMRYSLWGSLFIFYELNFLFIYTTHIHTNKVLKWKGFKQLDHIRYFFQRFFSIQPSTVQHRTYIRMRTYHCILLHSHWYTVISMLNAKCLTNSWDSVYVCSWIDMLVENQIQLTRTYEHTEYTEEAKKNIANKHIWCWEKKETRGRRGWIPTQTDAFACIIQMFAHAFM